MGLNAGAIGAVALALYRAAFASGPDVTFCELYGLAQYGRSGDTVGFSCATTSWNRDGTEPLLWYSAPDSRHPFIVQNLYRLKEDRLEQIGQSWAKHGFFALDNTQCTINGSFCSGTGASTLGLKCTDTYSASLNAQQTGNSGNGPRFEINAWTGQWDYSTSFTLHGLPTPLADTPISRRLQVHDDDIEPGVEDVQYFLEAYYLHRDDTNHMNSAAWKPVSFSGSPGGAWSVSMSGAATSPNIGFAIDAWAGSTQTVLAQQVPVIEGISPDGRCVLGAKAIDLGGGVWRYEYALLNIDMDRQVGAFAIPVPNGATIGDLGFHAVRHHDEPLNAPALLGGAPIDNAPWSAEVCGGHIVWTTTTNPLRWGTMYNFRFECDAPPSSAHATIRHFRPGDVMAVSGMTIAPSPSIEARIIGAPRCASPGSGLVIHAEVDEGSQNLASLVLHVSENGGSAFVPTPMSHAGGNRWSATYDPAACGGELLYYIEAIGSGGAIVADPVCAPSRTYASRIGAYTVVFEDDFETDKGWAVNLDGDDDATKGVWVRVAPIGTGVETERDRTPHGTMCYLTGQHPGFGADSANNVDGGKTTLTSPAFDLSGAHEATISYWRWYSNSRGGLRDDTWVVQVSENDGASWTTAETIGPNDPQRYGDWFRHTIHVQSLVMLTDRVRVRFIASDDNAPSLVEAALDDVVVEVFVCENPPAACAGDADGNGIVEANDVTYVILRLGETGTPGTVDGDADGSGTVDTDDITFVLLRLGACGD